MGKRFATPDGALTLNDVKNLKPGTMVWDVYGVLPIQKIREDQGMIFIRFEETSKNDFDHAFITKYPDGDFEVKKFCADRNMGGHSYNDNYTFDDFEKAQAAVKFIAESYADNREAYRSELDRQIDIYMMMEYDYYDDYDY